MLFNTTLKTAARVRPHSWGCLYDGTQAWLLHKPHNVTLEALGAVFGPMPGAWTGRLVGGVTDEDRTLLGAIAWTSDAATTRACSREWMPHQDVRVGQLDGAEVVAAIKGLTPEADGECWAMIHQCALGSGDLLARAELFVPCRAFNPAQPPTRLEMTAPPTPTTRSIAAPSRPRPIRARNTSSRPP